MGLIVLCGAVWSFGALVEIGNVATTKQSLTTLPVPFAGYLFAGSVDLFIFYGYLKCYGPAWQIALSVFHILVGLATSLWFQWQHSKGIVDPVAVSVVPALAVAVSLDTWVVSQLVEWRHTRNRPDWPIPVPQNPAPEDVPPTTTPPGPVQPAPVPPARPRPTQDVARTRGRPVGRGRPFTPDDHPKVRAWVDQGRTNKAEMARELGLHKRGQLDLGRYVNTYRGPVQVSQNGSGT
jgi:hypothetical protein